MEAEYFTPENDMNDITEVRYHKVREYLLENNSLLDFGLTEPLVSDLNYKSFETQLSSEFLFDDLPRFVKSLLNKAEHMLHYDTLFRKYLEDRDIYPRDYQKKNPKVKQDILYDWLFLNNLEPTILNL